MLYLNKQKRKGCVDMKHIKFHRLMINESIMNESSLDMPCEGIFWFIDNTLISFDYSVNISGSYFDGYEHIKLWNEIRDKYKVNGWVVDYDYYPRGRVMVNPMKDTNGKFTHYDVYIYIDNCINNDDIVEEVMYEFRLNKPNCNLKYVGADGGITSNHYTCHNCR